MWCSQFLILHRNYFEKQFLKKIEGRICHRYINEQKRTRTINRNHTKKKDD